MKVIPLKKKDDNLDLYIYIGKKGYKKSLWLCKNPESGDIFVVIGDNQTPDRSHQYMVPDKVVILTGDKDGQKHEQLLDLMSEMDEDEFPADAKCFRCNNDASQTWDICSDNNNLRFICKECDVKLNEMVLKFMGFKDWKKKIERYKKSIEEE